MIKGGPIAKACEKKCAICSHVVSGSLIQCPKCGSGVFEKPRAKRRRGWLSRVFGESNEAGGASSRKTADSASISVLEKQDQRKEKEVWIIEWSETVLSNDDMRKLRDALKTAPILSNARILHKKKQAVDYMEGNLDQVLHRLTGYMHKDSKRPEFMGFRANWVDNEYVNVPTCLRRPDGTATFWNLLILRKSDEVFCLVA